MCICPSPLSPSHPRIKDWSLGCGELCHALSKQKETASHKTANDHSLNKLGPACRGHSSTGDWPFKSSGSGSETLRVRMATYNYS
jgi:hypothetical protein